MKDVQESISDTCEGQAKAVSYELPVSLSKKVIVRVKGEVVTKDICVSTDQGKVKKISVPAEHCLRRKEN